MKMLENEAKSKNKKIAMNDNDNEIRLTDNEGDDESVSEPNLKLSNSESESQSFHVSKNFIDTGNVLPEALVTRYNLERELGINRFKNRLDISGSTIQGLNSKLEEIGRSGSSFTRIFHF